MRVRILLLCAAAVAIVGGAGLAAGLGRARHLALPVASDPSLPPAPPLSLLDAPPCAATEVARVGTRVTALLEAAGGDLWIGTFDGGLFLRPAEGGEVALPLAGRERFVNALAEHDGLVWAATQGGLVAFDGERRVVTLVAGEAASALVRARGRLYAGTGRGLHRVEVDGATALEATGPAGEPLRVTALAAGSQDLWIGTASGAYALALAAVEAPLQQRTARWHPLVFGDPPAETNVVTALVALPGAVVAGTDDGGLVRLRAEGGASCARFADPRANAVSPGAAAAAGGVALFGTQGGGVLLVPARPGALEVARPSDLAHGEISAIAPAREGALAGTAAGAVLRLACPGPRVPAA